MISNKRSHRKSHGTLNAACKFYNILPIYSMSGNWNSSEKFKWFISLFAFSVVIDLVTLSMNITYQIPINLGYLGLLGSYGIMWFFGSSIANTKSFSKFLAFTVLATLIAFLISTQTYNLLSGTFPDITIKESIQTGWEYLPQSFVFTMSYLVAYWGIQSLFRRQFVSQKATAL